MKKLLLLFILTVLIVPASLFAEEGSAGHAGSFLRVPIGARPTAMGSAYISISDDAAGLFYNPAGLSMIRQKTFATSYRSMSLDRTLASTAVLLPAQGNSILGFSWLYAGSGSVETRDDDGDLRGFDLSENNHQISILFAKRFEKYLSLGFKGSYLHTKFAEMSAFSVGIDLGATLYISQFFSREERDLKSIQDIKIGFVLRNLAATYKWNNDNYLSAHGNANAGGSDHIDDVPIEVGLGGSAKFLDSKLLLATDFVKVLDEKFFVNVGSEYLLTEQFAVRSGYTDRSVTAGFGYLFKLNNVGLIFDYAFSTDKVDEGSEHLFSFDILF